MHNVSIYSDGFCEPNPGIGAWAAILCCNDKTKEISGSKLIATTNQMKLLSVIKALNALKTYSNVNIYVNSEYIKKGITEWLYFWKKHEWKKSDNIIIKNLILWKELDILREKHNISWSWISENTDIELSIKCNKLAGEELIKLFMEPLIKCNK